MTEASPYGFSLGVQFLLTWLLDSLNQTDGVCPWHTTHQLLVICPNFSTIMLWFSIPLFGIVISIFFKSHVLLTEALTQVGNGQMAYGHQAESLVKKKAVLPKRVSQLVRTSFEIMVRHSAKRVSGHSSHFFESDSYFQDLDWEVASVKIYQTSRQM